MKARLWIKRILIILISALFLMSAYAMLSSANAEIELLTELGLLNYRVALGFTSILVALSLWNRTARSIGIFVGVAYLGGALASELSLGDSGLIPAVSIAMLWVIARLDRVRPVVSPTVQ